MSIQAGTMLVAVPFAALSRRLVVDADVGSLPATVWWTAGTASALDAGTISQGRDTGSVVAYDRRLAGREGHWRCAEQEHHDQRE